MTGSRHHLRKQTLRVTLESEEQALALQPRLSDFNRRRLLAIIEKVFDAVDVPGLHLRIDRLDVDLGTVPFDDFEQVVEERLTLRLQEAVEQVVQARRSSTREEDRPRTEEELRLELLEHYLLHGTLPFWAPHGVAFSFGALFAELARSSPAALVRLVGKHATLGRVLDRLVLQLDPRQLEQLVMLLEPKHAALLIDYIVSLQALHRIEPVLPLSDRSLSRLLWSLTLTYLVKDAGSQFNRKSALKLLLEGVSESQGLDYPELLTTLDSGLEQVRKRHPVLASLSSVIGELVRELPLPEVEEVETPVLDEALATTESAAARYELAEALRYYLRNGELPWATLVRMPELTAERVVATLPELPRSLQRRVLGWEQSGGSLARLVRAVRRIPEEVLSKLLVRLMPRPGDEGSPLRSALPVFAARAEDKPLFFARLLAALLDGKPVILEELAATRVQAGPEDWGARDADLSRWEAHALKSALVSRLRFGGKAGPTVEALLSALLTSFPEDSRHFLLAIRETEDLRTVLVDRSGEDVLGRAMDLLRPRESRSMRALLQAMRGLPERVLPGGIEGARQTVFHELLLLGDMTPLSRSTVSRLLRRLFGAEMPLEAEGFLSRVIADWGASGGVLQRHAEVFRAALDHVRARGGASSPGDVDGSRREVLHDEMSTGSPARFLDSGAALPRMDVTLFSDGDTSSPSLDAIRIDHGDSDPHVQMAESGTHGHSVPLSGNAASVDRSGSASYRQSNVPIDHASRWQDDSASHGQDVAPLGLGHAASRGQGRNAVARGDSPENSQAEASLDYGPDSREQARKSGSRDDTALHAQDAASLSHDGSDSRGLAGPSLRHGDEASRAQNGASLNHDGARAGTSLGRIDSVPPARDSVPFSNDDARRRAQSEDHFSLSALDARVSDSAPLSVDTGDATHSGPRSTTALTTDATRPAVRHTDAPPPAAHASLTAEHLPHSNTDSIAATVEHARHERDALRARDAQPSGPPPPARAIPLPPGATSSHAEPAPLLRAPSSASPASGRPPSTERTINPLDVPSSTPQSPSTSESTPTNSTRPSTHDSPEAREALFAFLLAESADRYAGLSDDALLRLLHSLLDESPDVLHGFIRRHVHRRHLQEHWARILPDPLLARICAVLAPRLHTALLSTVEILIAAWQDVAPSDVPSLTERSAFWRFILELLGKRPGASLGLEQLVSAFLEHFSSRLRGAHPTHRDSRGVAERLLERAIELAHHESLPRLASVLHQRRSTFLAAWTTPPRSRPPTTRPARQHTSFQLGADKHGDNDGNPIYIDNAGLVLTSPFLPHLFRELGLTHVDDQGKTRLDPEPAMRAVHLLQYLVDGRTSAPEPLLVLNKILCGLPVPTPIPSGIEMTAQEQSLCDRLLKALIANWTIISSTSVAGLRETFLQREGRLEQLEDRWKLQVQRKTLDVLVDQVPWSLSILTHPWMPQPLYVSW